MLSLVKGISFPYEIVFSGYSVESEKRGENVFTYCTKAHICWGENVSNVVIAVLCVPLLIVIDKSSSVGSCPLRVLRNLKVPVVKLRGFVCKFAARTPSPFPFIP